ncbi:MAG TPA: rhamnulose-1-phosphate aldolase [Chloroflexi bacterium]|jgi:rhamnulose-1-phosphate aldolase|nr:rhamnulose-1-phosphate aldolase [Chloroflexota bacterium]HCG30027.1 rhamnulose-1-phosphate aldolase [Chloroflexota bacterium]
MPLTATPTGIDTWIAEMASAAVRLAALRAVEGAAGNISLFLPDDTPGLDRFLSERMPRAGKADVGDSAALPPGVLLITGTGRRLPDLARDPDQALCAIAFDQEGAVWLHRAPGDVRPTSEIDSHLGIHAATLAGHARVHAVVHAQPPKLTWLSHIPAYQDQARLNRQLLRWQPETMVMLSDGICVLPFVTPGTPEQGELTARAMRQHRLVIWSQHGVVARSDRGPAGCVDLIDYVETVAEYEVIDLIAGRPATGLTLDQLRQIARRFGLSSDLLDSLPEGVLLPGS